MKTNTQHDEAEDLKSPVIRSLICALQIVIGLFMLLALYAAMGEHDAAEMERDATVRAQAAAYCPGCGRIDRRF